MPSSLRHPLEAPLSTLGTFLLAYFLSIALVAARESPGIARLASKQIREIEARLSRIGDELKALPKIPSGSTGGSLGFHANSSNSGQEWVMVDLGRVRPIEMIALVPVNIVYAPGENRDYGFPGGFRIEVSDDEDFQACRTVADSNQQTVGNPVPAAVFETQDLSGRFVRVTATQPWTMPGTRRNVFALGELLVFSHGRNVAPGKIVTASHSIEAKPMWSVANLVDAQDGLGSPVTDQPSPRNGYHSEIESSSSIEKWVQVDLGREIAIDEVRVIPARPIDWAESHGFGFPTNFRVESSLRADFSESRILLDRTLTPFPNPGDNPIVIPVDDVTARYVRFIATRLWERESDFVFALSELQVFAKGRNIALGTTVIALDEVDVSSWSKQALVDGFDSRHQLETDEMGWLKGIVRRQRLWEESQILETRLQATIDTITARLIWLASAVGIALLALLGFTILRSRALRQRESDRLRTRIASDLHDEIGSNLGSIALLSEIGGSPEDLSEINRVARETTASMQDIAWVIRSGHDTLDDLLLRMREVAAAMLKKTDYTFTVCPETVPARRISLNFKRNMLLFFKEALHNLARHSQAREAFIRIEFSGRTFRLLIADDGQGFDPTAAESHSGSGLKNFRNRAEALHGSATIDSKQGKGTTILLDAPFR
jgi:signal transduction histidine kinase